MLMGHVEFRHEVMLCFWFSIHLEMFNSAVILYEMDPIIKDIMKNFRTDKAKAIIEAMRE